MTKRQIALDIIGGASIVAIPVIGFWLAYIFGG